MKVGSKKSVFDGQGNPMSSKPDDEQAFLYYLYAGQDWVSAPSIEAAVHQYMAYCNRAGIDIPEIITLYKCLPVTISEDDFPDPLMSIMIALEYTYGSEERERPKPSQAMIDANKALIDAVIKDYRPAKLELVETLEIELADYTWATAPKSKITNDHQYRLTQILAERLDKTIKDLKEVTPSHDFHPRLRQAELEAMESKLNDLLTEIAEYERGSQENDS